MLFHLLESQVALIHYAAEKIKQALHAAIQKKGHALLVLPGGETPRALYTVLSEMEIPWQKVILFLTDERWVGVSSQDSNSYWVRKLLLHHAEGLVEFINYKTAESNPKDAIESLNQQMRTYTEPFDFVLLGMGGDGHVASLFFPKKSNECINTSMENKKSIENIAVDLTQATSDVLYVRAPVAPYDRVSLSFSRLCHTQALAVLMTGATKWQQLQTSIYRAAVREASPLTAIEHLVRCSQFKTYDQSKTHNQTKAPVQIFWAP